MKSVFPNELRWLMFIPFLVISLLNVQSLSAAESRNEKLVDTFFEKGDVSAWFSRPTLIASFKELLDSCEYTGLNKHDYNYTIVKSLSDGVETTDNEKQRRFIEGLVNYFKDLKTGYRVDDYVGFNEISSRYSKADDSVLMAGLLAVRNQDDLKQFATVSEPNTAAYSVLKSELRAQILNGDNRKVMQLKHSLNLYRWILHYEFRQCIIVNIAANMLWYYEQDQLKLPMKVVVGKPATKTPRFAAHCNQVIFYPYWHVPRSIAVKEILPACKRNPGALNRQNLQALNSRGQIVDPYKINWKSLSASNFPYTLRQPTGCDNALGVIKFNLTSPYSVYLHDTNWKGAFSNNKRFFSHGCIRIEKPVELANYLLPGQVDKAFLERCIKGQQSVPKGLKLPVPVFVVYMTADADSTGNGVVYYPDTYKLL